jgi:tRNA (mo5U34)-methyltransferase
MAEQHSNEELRELFDSVKPWHHLIDVRGVATKTESAWGDDLDHPRVLWESVSELLPSLEGKRVLDVGCNDGFFLFACRRLGAKEVVGVEVREHYYDHAVLVNRLLDLGGITIHLMSAYDVGEALGQFDVTLALGLIYHLKNPFLFLERVSAITTSTIIVETAVRNSNDDLRNRELERIGAPCMEFIENPPSDLNPEGGPNWWVPNTECVSAMLRVCGFPQTLVASERILTPGKQRQPTEFGRAIVVGGRSSLPSPEQRDDTDRRVRFLARTRRRARVRDRWIRARRRSGRRNA